MQPKSFVKGKHQYTRWGSTTEVRAMSESKSTQPPAPALQVEADPQTAVGAYANLAAVVHSETEFVLDFLFLPPGQTKASLRSRVVSSPLHTKRLLAALADNVRKYEARFGVIAEPASKP